MVSVTAAVLLARMALTAAIVVAAAWAAERSSPFLGAMLATLPISAGPAYVFLALDHGPDFVAAGAVTSLAAIGAAAAFVAAYAGVAARAPMPLALAAAVAGWAAYLAAISPVTWTAPGAWRAPGAFAVSVGATLLGIAATRWTRSHAAPSLPPAKAWHVLVRAASVMALVAAVTLIGEALGPAAAGIASVVPVVFTSFVLLLQPRIGGLATAALMSHGLTGMLGFAPALYWLHLAAVPLGAAPALAGALAICLAWNGALVLALRRTHPTAAG